MKPTLVSGAAGQMGGTGRHLVDILIDRGAPVRAMVRQRDARSDRLASIGAEVIVADFLDEDAMTSAMDGVGAAYFCAPVSDVLLHATTVFALAAKAGGVGRIINVSQMGTKDPILSPATRLHRLSELVFDWSGVPTSHLRATVYLEQLARFFGPGVREQGRLAAPMGGERMCMVAGVDVARVAAGIALHPDRFGPGPYHLTGPHNFTFEEAARTMTEILGRPIAYVDIEPETWKAGLLSWGFSPHLASHLDKLYEKGRMGRLDHTPTDVVETVGGARAMSLAEFVEASRGSFA